jgi:hypothetical protein
MSKPTCASCDLYESHDSTCHRRKPHTSGFPFVRVNDWCGEHKSIYAPKVTENLT